jgi:hypothetical protein
MQKPPGLPDGPAVLYKLQCTRRAVGMCRASDLSSPQMSFSISYGARLYLTSRGEANQIAHEPCRISSQLMA